MSGGLSQCAHADILEGYPDHDSWSGYFFYSKGHLRGVAIDFLDRFVHGNRNWRAAGFAKRAMAAAAVWLTHFIAVAFQHLAQLVKTKIAR